MAGCAIPIVIRETVQDDQGVIPFDALSLSPKSVNCDIRELLGYINESLYSWWLHTSCHPLLSITVFTGVGTRLPGDVAAMILLTTWAVVDKYHFIVLEGASMETMRAIWDSFVSRGWPTEPLGHLIAISPDPPKLEKLARNICLEGSAEPTVRFVRNFLPVILRQLAFMNGPAWVAAVPPLQLALYSLLQHERIDRDQLLSQVALTMTQEQFAVVGPGFYTPVPLKAPTINQFLL